MKRSDPIGIFDSGVGGLTVFKEITTLLPHENILYLADTARMPYGNKSPEEILRYSMEGVTFLINRNIKLLVLACHTVSAYALEEIQEHFAIPVIGMIQPGFEELMQATRNMKIAILGTEATIRSQIYQKLIQDHYPKSSVFPVSCPLLAPMIEEGLAHHPITKSIAEHYLAPLKKEAIDTALLACTHYPLIRNQIQEILGPLVKLIEPASLSAQQVNQWLFSSSLLNLQMGAPNYQFFTTNKSLKFNKTKKLFLPQRRLSEINTEND